MKFIAAMDHSGGSTGGVLERYGQEYTEDNKMDLVHSMRLRMVSSPDFTSDKIWAAILYKDTIDKGMNPILKEKGIKSYLKIDSGLEEDGTLKDFNDTAMCAYAFSKECSGTKMRSVVHDIYSIEKVLEQQFEIALRINMNFNLMPIIEPEISINNPNKTSIEKDLSRYLATYLKNYKGRCILKLTIPDDHTTYDSLHSYNNVEKIVGLSGGYTTKEACAKLSICKDMTASFSRALSEGLYASQTDRQFNKSISHNIHRIFDAGKTRYPKPSIVE